MNAKKSRIKNFKEAVLPDRTGIDTLFVLGSGPSINELTDEQWNVIKSNHSVGFNFWVLHDFVPTYYFMECINPVKDPDGRALYFDIIRKKRAAYQIVIKVLMELQWSHSMDSLALHKDIWPENLFYMNRRNILSPDANTLVRSLKYYSLLDANIVGKPFSELVKYNNSLSALIFFGYLLGYKRIVLCGCDMKGADFFYHDPLRYPDVCNFRKKPPEWAKKQLQNGNKDLSTLKYYAQNKTSMLMPFGEFVENLNILFEQNGGPVIKLQSENSSLWPKVEIYDWKC